jgi:hypothetical protein
MLPYQSRRRKLRVPFSSNIDQKGRSLIRNNATIKLNHHTIRGDVWLSLLLLRRRMQTSVSSKLLWPLEPIALLEKGDALGVQHGVDTGDDPVDIFRRFAGFVVIDSASVLVGEFPVQ